MAQETLYVHKGKDAELARVAEALNTVTYAATMTPNAATGSHVIITANDGNAFTIAAPTNALDGQLLTIKIKNTSGGALGAITWNAVFKMSAWTSPATGNSRTIGFVFDGTNWVEVFKTAADVPN